MPGQGFIWDGERGGRLEEWEECCPPYEVRLPIFFQWLTSVQQIELKWPAGNWHAGNPHAENPQAENMQCSLAFLSVTATYVHTSRE